MQRARKRRHMVHKGGHGPIVVALVEGWLPFAKEALSMIVQLLGAVYGAIRISELPTVRKWWRRIRSKWSG